MVSNPPDVADQLVQDVSDMINACEASALADEFKYLPSAEEAGLESEDNQNNQPQNRAGNQAEKTSRVREAAQKRSAALKAFLAAGWNPGCAPKPAQPDR